MATINLGAIKFKWQGAYNAGTAYTVDDVVSYQGSSYICILASTGNLPTNATYWEQMSAKGTDGTDADLLSISGTVQGDIYYNNGGAIARLPAGTAGDALITNGTGANPSWGTVAGGKVLQVVSSGLINVTSDTTSTSYVAVPSHSLAITPSATSSKVFMMFSFNARSYATANSYFTLYRDSTNLSSGDGFTILHDDSGSEDTEVQCTLQFLDSPNTTSATTYALYYKADSGNGSRVNQKGSDSVITLMEIGA